MHCAKRNVHSRSLDEVQALSNGWESTPDYMNRLDLSTHFHMGEIEHVGIDDKTSSSNKVDHDDNEVRKYRHSAIASLSKASISTL